MTECPFTLEFGVRNGLLSFEASLSDISLTVLASSLADTSPAIFGLPLDKICCSGAT